MKKITDVLGAVCSIASAIVIYLTALEAAEGRNVLIYVLASVFSVCLSAAMFVISRLSTKLEGLEEKVNFLYDAPEDDSEGEEVYPDGDPAPYYGDGSDEVFKTEDPDYNGTDFSGDEVVSANSDDEILNQ